MMMELNDVFVCMFKNMHVCSMFTLGHPVVLHNVATEYLITINTTIY
jgi:hypothetical protein